MRIAVIGGGAFGVATATQLALAGESVTLFERLPGLLQGTSALANRLHRGFHYPRHEQTARQCALGFEAFAREFAEAILPGVDNTYFIASEGSLTSPREFLEFCGRQGLRYRVLDLERQQPRVAKVALGVATEEAIYDRAVLKTLMIERLRRSGAEVRVDLDVIELRRDHGGFALATGDGVWSRHDAVVNCSYADHNRLSAGLGHAVEARQYEYAAAAVIELDWPCPASLTVLDGPFLSLLPLAEPGQHLLYHVEQAVIARHDGPVLDRGWLDPGTSPFAAVDQRRWFATLLERCCEFVPELRHARLQGVLQGPRMVLADAEATDARPSSVSSLEPGYVVVFSGKIDHCLWVADEVASVLGCLAPA